MNAPDALLPGAATVRLPDVPYPGLRPFLDHEEILLFGRERQVRDVIERLGQTQFVAVIGGSGSGKSSLILAGVVPELRAFGIPGAGDFWLPLVTTPGTNASAADQAARRNTPITRLARKFAALLRSRGSAEKNEARVAEIAARLREELGLSELVEIYTPELATPPGPRPEDARLLFVIDQFEELFHPTTRNSPDARLMVERVIDHFFSPHPRCYLVLTMRSEHLNDCAAYLELPDAINKASYLVRRLDDEQLREAITGPAQRLLRLLQLQEDSRLRLPDAVGFETAVVERLVHDVRAIDGDPDHLPLLQHVLARTWDAAKARAAWGLDLPDRIQAADLAAAAGVPAAAGAAIDPGLNVLRASLEHWAEAAYQGHDEAGRALLDRVLRRLAVKDPDTGMYSQQRLNVDDSPRLLGADVTPARLHVLLERGFLGGVDYLFWDEGNPERVTLKVSHESFIRGWSRLRRAIDADAERFEELVDLLRKCQEWVHGDRSAELLLESGDLRRARDAALPDVLANPDERSEWFRRLAALRGQAHLAVLENEVGAFVQASDERVRVQQGAEQRRRRNRRVMGVGALLLVPPLLYWTVVQGPSFNRMELLVLAATVAGAPDPLGDNGVGSNARTLRVLVDAAAMVDRGRRGSDTPLQTLNRAVLDNLSAMPFVGRRTDLVDDLAAVAEPIVNGNLRFLLETSVWKTTWPTPLPKEREITSARVEPDVECSWARQGRDERVAGQLLTAFNANNPKLSRSVFVPSRGADAADDVVLMSARASRGADGALAGCTVDQRLASIPGFLQPALAFDANLRFMLRVDNEPGKPQAVTLSEIDWERTDEEGGRRVDTRERFVLQAQADAQGLARAIGQGAGGAVVRLETMRAPLGRAILVDGQAWRLVDQVAQRIAAGAADADLHALVPAPAGSGCALLQDKLQQTLSPGFTSRVLVDADDPKHCFAISKGRPPEPPVPGQSTPKMHHVVVAVYARPSKAVAEVKTTPPAPIASLPRFTRVQPDEEPVWRVGRADSRYAGWIAVWSRDSTGQGRHVAAPWSTCALWRLGSQVLAEQDPRFRAAEDPRNAQVCGGPVP